MKRRSDDLSMESLRDKVIGLGERSIRKSYYPELQQRIDELERFRALLDQTRDLIFLLDKDCMIIDVNDSACTTLGFPREEIVGKPLEMIVDDDEGRIRAFSCGEGSAGETRIYLATLKKSDGAGLPGEIKLNRVVFQAQSYAVAVARDVSEKQAAEEAKRREEVLKRLNQELEGRVQERTVELSQANLMLRTAQLHLEKASYIARLNAERYRDYQIRLKKIVAISLAMLSDNTLEEVLQQIVDTARTVIGARYVVAGHGFMEGTFVVNAISRHEAAAPCPPGREFQVERGGVYLEVIEKDAPLRLTDQEMRKHPRWVGLPEGHADLRGLLAVPIKTRSGTTRGFIMASDKLGGGNFDEDDETLLMHLAGIGSLGLCHAECLAGGRR